MSKKRLSQEDFDKIVSTMRLSDKNKQIAKQVLVQGRKAREVSKESGITPQAVSNIIKSVWRKFQSSKPAESSSNQAELYKLQQEYEDKPGYIFWKDKKSVYLGCNKKLAQLLGLKSPSEIVGKTDEDFPWGTQSPNQIRQDDLTTIQTGERQVSEFNLPYKRPDGQQVRVRSEKMRLTDKNLQTIGVLVIATDITDERISKKEKNKEKKKKLIESSKIETKATEQETPSAITAEDLKKSTFKATRKKSKEPERRQEELDYAFDSNAAIMADSPRWVSKILYLFLLFIFIGIIWAYFAKLDEITVGFGKVIPSSEVQIIQNLEGGIVKKINVAEGDIVEKGQILLILDDTQFNALYQENLARKHVLEAMIARLQAQAEGDKTINFPPGLEKSHPDLVASERRLFESHQQTLEDMLKALKDNYALINKEVQLVKPAVKEGIVSKVEFYRLTRQANDLKRQINELIDKNRRESLLELNQRKAELASLNESLRALKDRTERTVIRSPVTGIVNNLRANTIGAVIRPGVDIMEVVPLKGHLLIEAKVRPADIAFIKVGQKATIKFTAYDFSIYGGLPAKVTTISPTTITDEEGNSYYEVKLRTEKSYLGTEENPLPIIPGMTATVHIITGEKSVLSYILKPILKAKQNALRER